MIQQQLQVAEAQLSQLQANALLDKRVETKLQLAQVDLQASTLKGELKTEKQRYSKLTTQLVTLQLQYDGLQEQHKELQDIAKQQQLHAAGLGDSCQPLPGVLSSCRDDSGDMSQGEGLTLQSVHSASYAQQPVAALSMAPQVKRNMSSLAGTTATKDSSSGGSGSWSWGSWINRPVNNLIRSDSSASGSGAAANGVAGTGSASSISSARMSGTPRFSSSMNGSSNSSRTGASSSYSSSSLQRQPLQQDGGYTASSLLAQSRSQRLNSYDAADEPRSSGSSDQGRFSSADQLKRSPPLARQSWGPSDSMF
jgi:hypothetical protein